MRKCKHCISNNIWTSFLPSSLLKVCNYCAETGIPYSKNFERGEKIAFFSYVILICLLFFNN